MESEVLLFRFRQLVTQVSDGPTLRQMKEIVDTQISIYDFALPNHTPQLEDEPAKPIVKDVDVVTFTKPMKKGEWVSIDEAPEVHFAFKGWNEKGKKIGKGYHVKTTHFEGKVTYRGKLKVTFTSTNGITHKMNYSMIKYVMIP
jgi:hypothetical protein